MNRSLRDRLAALEQSTARVAQREAREETLAPEPGDDWLGLKALGFQLDTSMAGPEGLVGCWRRTLRYDLLTRHGVGRFADISTVDLTPVYKAARVSRSEATIPLEGVGHLRFYDTETSGLGTGAGTFPFLHAVARIDEDELVLDQYFLADHSQESILLRTLWGQHFQDPGTLVVSFNGKSFDWPLLKSRLVMHRVQTDAAKMGHVDLLPMSRRLWKRKLGRVSLGFVEAQVLGLTRQDDLPGSQAPARYFEFLENKDATRLEPVFNHNAMDVCSLVSLMSHIARVMLHETDVDTAGEYLALATWHDEWGEVDLAAGCYRAANERPDSTWQSMWAESMHHKRLRRYDVAERVWRAMADRFPWSVAPLVELAKQAEHRWKQWDDALALTDEALRRAIASRQMNRRSFGPGSLQAGPEVAALRHRRDRILAKRNGTQ